MCAISLLNLATCERQLGEYRQAWAHFAESFSMGRALGIREIIVEVLYGSAALAEVTGDHRWAGVLIGAAQREGDFGHVFDSEANRVALDRTMSSVKKNLGRDGLKSALAAGRALTLDARRISPDRLPDPPGDYEDVRLPSMPEGNHQRDRSARAAIPAGSCPIHTCARPYG